MPIISDRWDGLDAFFCPGRDILLADTAADVAQALRGVSEAERRALAAGARRRVLEAHTAAHRAGELERLLRTAAASAPEPLLVTQDL